MVALTSANALEHMLLIEKLRGLCRRSSMIVDAVYVSIIVGLLSIAGLTLYAVGMIAIELGKIVRRRRIAGTQVGRGAARVRV
jgi:hypothetical protein